MFSSGLSLSLISSEFITFYMQASKGSYRRPYICGQYFLDKTSKEVEERFDEKDKKINYIRF